jgi:hypothetical protein
LRLHAATRERPADRLLVERTRLRPLPERPPHVELVLPAIVSKEAHVRLDTNTYSVPPNLVGQSVLVRADEQTYDDLFKHTKHALPAPQVPPTGAAPQLTPPGAAEGAAPRGPGKPDDD